MSENAKKTIEALAKKMMSESISDDYINQILNHQNDSKETFIDAVVRDVMETSAWQEEKYFNEDDVKLAIGREFITRLGINN